MDRAAYQTARWRSLPRDRCTVEFLFGPAAGPCHGLIHRHHVDPDDPESRSLEVCAVHHPTLQAALQRLTRPAERRRCGHRHRYDHARRECEARLNRAA
jgi:hypothetical protein